MTPTSDEPRTHLILFDGVCGLCVRLNQFVLRHDRRGLFVFAPLQGALARDLLRTFGHDADRLDTFFIVADYRSNRPRLLDRSNAALFLIQALGWPWRVLAVGRVLPRRLRDFAYDAVARRRYRLFGELEHCAIPTPEQAARFLDS